MKIKFTKKATKEIKKWLKKNGFGEVDCDLTAGEFQFDPNDYTILAPRNYDDSVDYLFMRCLRKLGLTSDFDAITLSILHELGHAETHALFTNKEHKSFNSDKFLLELSDIDGEDRFFKYWEVKDELAANTWAIMYTKCFTNKVQKLEEIVEKYVKIT